MREVANGEATVANLILAGLALAGINEQSGYHIGDGRADKQCDVKHSDKFQ